MDPVALKVSYEFTLKPSKSNLQLFHEFIEKYPINKLNNNKVIFVNTLITEIRKCSDISQQCISELLFILNLITPLEDDKILCFVLEETGNFIQSYVALRSTTKQPDDFNCFNLELSLNVLKIFKIVFCEPKNQKISTSIYSPSSLLLLGYIVSFLLYYCEYFKERELQNEALSSLLGIVSNEFKSSHKPDIIVNFTPGIFQTLTKIIKADRKIGYTVKSKAIECLGKLIVLIYGDQFLNSPKSSQLNWGNYPEFQEILVDRNDAWKRKTWGNVAKIIKIMKFSIFERSDEEHWRVKMQLLKSCMTVLQNCSCVGQSAIDLIECLIVSCSDFDLSVREKAYSCIDEVSKMKFNIPIYWDKEKQDNSEIVHSGCALLSIVVRSNLDKVIDALKELPTIPSDDIKCNLLHVLKGYLSINDKVRLTILNCIQLKQIITYLISIIKLDHNRLDLFEPVCLIDDNFYISNNTINSRDNCNFFMKHFCLFKNDKVVSIIKQIISGIISLVDPNSVLLMVQSLMEEKPEDFIAFVYFTKLFIESVSNHDSVEIGIKINLCKSALITYFDGETMSLKTTNDSVSDHVSGDFWKDTVAAIAYKPIHNTFMICNNNLSSALLKQNTLCLSLIMELCAACCSCFQRCNVGEDIESWLMRQCLFEVMNKSQQSPNILSHAATECLRFLSRTHPKYLNSIPIVLRINADYVLDSIARRFRSAAILLKARSFDSVTFLKADAACRCLISVCKYAEADIMPFMQTILNQLLYCLDETHGSGDSHLFLSVLTELVTAICRWRQVSTSRILSIQETKQSEFKSLLDTTHVRQFIIERNDILVSSGFRKDIREVPIEHLEEESYFDDKSVEQNEQKRDVSPMTIALQNIVDRCIHLMSNSISRIRLVAIEILINAVIGLQHDEDVIKPVVHQIWAPLEHRLWDKEFSVIIKAFELVNTISQLCGEFLYVKIKTGFVKKLCVLLERCATKSLSPTATMKYSGLYKLQINLLLFLSQLSVRTSIHDFDLEQVVDAVIAYLDDRQPVDLISASIMSLQTIFLNDPSLVWFKVAQIQSSICNNGMNDTSHICGHINRSYDTHYLRHAKDLLKNFENFI